MPSGVTPLPRRTSGHRLHLLCRCVPPPVVEDRPPLVRVRVGVRFRVRVRARVGVRVRVKVRVRIRVRVRVGVGVGVRA